ncbi:MAG: hypothetical protein MAG551_02507 [Candidatus Scalindua arabica]|uniref:Ankyrin repeat domain-containing protein n=1 Tax=Candidatus Scalindua arabica TaxID=1127984 RepID=A0A941W4X4_9BACT|nr:hypothetical protein [Candidatus Scalindua arabica]
MMEFRFVQYLLRVVTIILVSGCVMDSKVVRLKYAAINGDTDTVKSVLAEGGDVNINIKDENGNTALMHAAAGSKVDIAKILIDAGANVNAKNRKRDTALIIAAWHGQVNMVEALINAGADVSVKNKDGNTALKIAAEINDQKKITSLLVEAGAVK